MTMYALVRNRDGLIQQIGTGPNAVPTGYSDVMLTDAQYSEWQTNFATSEGAGVTYVNGVLTALPRPTPPPPTTVAADAGLGASAPAPIIRAINTGVSADLECAIAMGSGTSPQPDPNHHGFYPLVTVTFSQAMAAAPGGGVVNPLDTGTAATLGTLVADAFSTTGYTVYSQNPPAASQALGTYKVGVALK